MADVFVMVCRMLLRKKRGAPHSCFCVPHPQKNVFAGAHTTRRVLERESAGVEASKRRVWLSMHRENGNLIAVKWTEGKMVAAIMRQKGKM